jgi:hypothetical protein
MIKTRGNKFGDALPMISVMWFINFTLFAVAWWGGKYLTIELGMKWAEEPLVASLVSLAITKTMLSGMLFAAIFGRFNVKMD